MNKFHIVSTVVKGSGLTVTKYFDDNNSEIPDVNISKVSFAKPPCKL